MKSEFIVDRYLQSEVEVLYLTDGGQYRDKGTLTEYDGAFVIVEKPTSEMFLIPVSAIRIIKVLSPPKENDTVLLRPAEDDQELATLKGARKKSE